MPYLKPCHATGFNNNGTKVYTVTYRRASPASAHRHDSRAALSEVKDIDDISTETIIIIITRNRSCQPAHVRAAASSPQARLMPAHLLLLLRSIYHPHIQRRLTPSALPTYHAAGLQAEQESLPVHKRSVAGSCGKLGGSHQPARGAVGSLESQKRYKLSVRYPAFLAGALAPPMGHLFASAYRTRGGIMSNNADFF